MFLWFQWNAPPTDNYITLTRGPSFLSVVSKVTPWLTYCLLFCSFGNFQLALSEFLVPNVSKKYIQAEALNCINQLINYNSDSRTTMLLSINIQGAPKK